MRVNIVRLINHVALISTTPIVVSTVSRHYFFLLQKLVKRPVGAGGTSCWDLTVKRRRCTDFGTSLNQAISCAEGIVE